MLESVKISRRQSEIRSELSTLAGKADATADEIRTMETLDAEYRSNETRYRAALIAEDGERREAGNELETRSDREFADLVAGFEMRQVVLALDEGRTLEGRTAEVVQELRSAGGYRGVPVPLMALETRAGETIASGTPDPIQTRPIIDRLFPGSVAAQMGAQLISIGSGAVEWPVTTSAVTAGWANGELANVAGPTTYATTDKALKPEQTLGIHMRVSRKAMLQSGAALEQAIRRDMSGTMGAELDMALFLGTGANGQPLGVVAGAGTYGITSTSAAGPATWAALRAAVVRFMAANAASGPEAVKALIRPEMWSYMDGTEAFTGSGVTEFDRAKAQLGGIVQTANALPTPGGTPPVALLTTNAGGVAPVFVGLWGAVDLIRDPYSDAQSGGLRLTALTTADVTVARPAQLQVVTGLEITDPS
ncbi:phage major capsid protein [Sphingopyxis granuli]|uniref:phage major capsid protein n=1 Tax=Sphingopyxis granuli TaxID=267128 RepID=UPI001BAFA423|nr:phage major capsid protein [Sphingopyxis granuli]QUM71508.1 phage major capsid protein [Sphingopyxis granuli]